MGPDVKDCSKKFPRAILYAAGMQTVINGTIHLVAAGATDPALYPDWEPGYLRYVLKMQASTARQPCQSVAFRGVGSMTRQALGCRGKFY